MDFNVLLTAHYQRVNAALQRFIAQLPFQSTPLVNAMEYGALLGVSGCAHSWCMPRVKCCMLTMLRSMRQPLPLNVFTRIP
ncbi:hypothetical protein ERHA55_11320 [Erwinia rhapontici]|nr:hypothetical protein ERHA55_11320 [Erwinia rhapontici]